MNTGAARLRNISDILMPMKILCTGDWHLGNVFHGNDRLPEHRHFLAWLTERIGEHRPDLLLIAGDVFDNANPSAAAQKAFYTFLVEATEACSDLQIVLIAGNHDSAYRLEAPRDLLRCHRVEVRGAVRRRPLVDTDPDDEGRPALAYDLDDLILPVAGRSPQDRVVVLAVPFLRAEFAVEGSYSRGVNGLLSALTLRARQLHPGVPMVMMAHMYATGAEIAATDASERLVIGGQEQVDLALADGRPDYLTCGHIHKRQHLWGTDWARYPGSVLPMSFAELDYRHGVDLVHIAAGAKPQVDFLEYQPQHRLVSLPRGEAAAELEELKRLVAQELPDRAADGQLSARSCYLELKLATPRVLPEVRAEIERAVAAKDAVICRLQQVYTALDGADIAQPERFRSVDDVLRRDPAEAVMECFQIRKKAPMNERQARLVDEAVRAAREAIRTETEEQDHETTETRDA